jgi:hypothetical protein
MNREMPPQHRWMGVGRSAAVEPPAAAREAVDGARAGRDAALVVLFASETYDLPALVTAAHAAAGTRLIGCSTSGEIATSGPGEAGVVAVALGGEGFRVSTSLARGLGLRAREAGGEAAAALGDVADMPHRMLMLLADGLTGDPQEVVRGAYGVAGAGVPLVGGCAGDDLAMRATHQFFDGQVLCDAVVAAAVGSDGPLGIGVCHGWNPVGEAMLVTGATRNRVLTLDDQPALDVYLERLGAPDAARADPDAFAAFSLTHPLGMARRAGEEQVRFIPGGDFERRALVTLADVPPGRLVWLMRGDDASVLGATDVACAEAIAGLGGVSPAGLMVFDCVARRNVLGEDGAITEIARVAEHAQGAPVAGFYSYGEIARTRGVSGFHNQTLVVLAVA